MAYYEMVVITRQDLAPNQVELIIDSFEKIIKDSGGDIHRRENWGLIDLQYQIKKNKKGHYTLINYQSNWQIMKEIERQMSISQDILRFITLKQEKPISETSVFLKRKEARQAKEETLSFIAEEGNI